MGSLPHIDIVEDCKGILQVYSDGSIFRADDIGFDTPLHDDGSVAWKDLPFYEKHGLHLRLYKPNRRRSSIDLLPVLYFIHGGGFCLGSRSWPHWHNCCLRLSSSLRAVVVSPDYRLAPEHRLPAAVEDSLASLKWLQAQALDRSGEPWLLDGVGFDRVFVLGDSSGGNIAHHLAVRLGPGSKELAPVRIRGYVLMAPYFGGTVRTRSEAEGPAEPVLDMEILDRFWRLSLPVGSNRDHPFANPFGAHSPNLRHVMMDPVLVIVGANEILKDRVEEYAKKLKVMGKKVEYIEFEGEQHGFFTNNSFSEVGNRVIEGIENFMSKDFVV